MSNTNKFMFEAKRLDNGEVIQGYYCYGYGGESEKYIPCISVMNNGSPSDTAIDPSTIKPLFTTNKPDAFIFENVDRKMLEELSDSEKLIVINSLGSDCLSMLWGDGSWNDARKSATAIDLQVVYRVKAPGYSIDEARNDIIDSLQASYDEDRFNGRGDNSQPLICLSEAFNIVADGIDKFAKANGLGGDE